MADEINSSFKQLFEGFSKLERPDRLKRLQEMGVLTSEDISYLKKSSGLDISLAENFIENVPFILCTFHM